MTVGKRAWRGDGQGVERLPSSMGLRRWVGEMNGVAYSSDDDCFSFFTSVGGGGESRDSRGTHLVFWVPFTQAPLPSIHSTLPSITSPFSSVTFTFSPGLGTGEDMARREFQGCSLDKTLFFRNSA